METVLFVPDKTLYRIINAEVQTMLTGSINNRETEGTQLAKGIYLTTTENRRKYRNKNNKEIREKSFACVRIITGLWVKIINGN